MVEVRRDLHALAECVACIEGALTGPWHPTYGSPVPASKTPPGGRHRRVTATSGKLVSVAGTMPDVAVARLMEWPSRRSPSVGIAFYDRAVRD